MIHEEFWSFWNLFPLSLAAIGLGMLVGLVAIAVGLGKIASAMRSQRDFEREKFFVERQDQLEAVERIRVRNTNP